MSKRQVVTGAAGPQCSQADHELLDGWRQGDPESQRKIDALVRRLIFEEVKARRIPHPGAEADDLRQEALLVVLRKLEDFRGGSLVGWLRVIVRNLALDRRRRESLRARRLDDLGWLLQAALGPAASDARQQLFETIRRLRVLLPPEQLRVVWFSALGYSAKEIAEMVGTPVTTVTSRLAHAKKTYRSDIELIKLVIKHTR